jgi:hypothetical protein
MTRIQILNEIHRLLTKDCGNCPMNKEYKTQFMRGNDTKLSKHCNKVCPTGQKLQACGRELAALW